MILVTAQKSGKIDIKTNMLETQNHQAMKRSIQTDIGCRLPWMLIARRHARERRAITTSCMRDGIKVIGEIKKIMSGVAILMRRWTTAGQDRMKIPLDFVHEIVEIRSGL